MYRIDLSLSNSTLYAGCTIETVAGRANLTTPIPDAIEIIGRNVASMVEPLTSAERQQLTLTGPMAVWAYLVVFHHVVHRFARVYYDDGRNPPVLIAAHGS